MTLVTKERKKKARNTTKKKLQKKQQIITHVTCKYQQTASKSMQLFDHQNVKSWPSYEPI